MEIKELVNIGKIIGTHGYKGTLKVEVLTDFPQRFQGLKDIRIKKGDSIKEFSIENSSLNKGQLLLKLAGIDSKEEAQKYRNFYLVVGEDELYPLPEGSYYMFQLIGMEVFEQEKGHLGKISDILETGANDVYVVNSETYGEILIPAIKEVIIEVNLEAKRMQVKLLPGLISMPESEG